MMRAVSWCVRHGVHQKITVGSPHRSARRRQAAHSSCRRWPAVGGGWPLLPTARGELALTLCVAPGWRRRQDGAAGTPHGPAHARSQPRTGWPRPYACGLRIGRITTYVTTSWFEGVPIYQICLTDLRCLLARYL